MPTSAVTSRVVEQSQALPVVLLLPFLPLLLSRSAEQRLSSYVRVMTPRYLTVTFDYNKEISRL